MPAQDLQRVVTELKGGGFRFGHGRLSLGWFPQRYLSV
jgi:hypothetical protein